MKAKETLDRQAKLTASSMLASARMALSAISPWAMGGAGTFGVGLRAGA